MTAVSEPSSPLAEVLERAERAAAVAREHAPRVDAEGSFPREAIDALRDQGLLGLISAAEVGGLGCGPVAAARVVERMARECGSTAMVLCMHYAGTRVVEEFGPEDVRRGLTNGERFTTLAFSEAGSRSHFWAPVGSATRNGDKVTLEANKSWVTSSSHATDFVWSSRPYNGSGGVSTIWLVPARAEGISIPRRFDGLGLRGNDSTPVDARGVEVEASACLGEDGKGFDVMMGSVLPLFSLMNSACSVGLMEGAVARSIEHVSGTKYEHLDTKLADLPTIRSYVARMRIETDKARALWNDAAEAVASGREDAMLRVLEVKAACGEAALQVTDTAMRVCGGAAFRKDVGVDRYFRDARASSVMAPTSDQLYDFIGKAVCGMPLFE